jgi:putative transposase
MSERRFGRTPGGVSSLGLRVVWCPKYRRRLSELLEQIVAKEVMPDRRAKVVRAFKGRAAPVLRQEFPHLRNHAKVLWSPSYFAASVGYVSESPVRRYIEHRWGVVMAS